MPVGQSDGIYASTFNFPTSIQLVKVQPHLKPDGVDYLAEDEQRENPESTEDRGQDEL